MLCALAACAHIGHAHADVNPEDIGESDIIPSYYQQAGGSELRSFVRDNFNEKVDPFTGKLQIHMIDFSIPGPAGMDLVVQRSYHSLNEQLEDPTPYGLGWTMHFGRVMGYARFGICNLQNAFGKNSAVVELPDGSRQPLYPDPSRTHFLTTTGWKGQCAPGGGMNVWSPDGTRYEMTHPGGLIGPPGAAQQSYYTEKIVDKHGNEINITYEAQILYKVIKEITTSDGRKLVFKYKDAPSGSDILESITDESMPGFSPRMVEYKYDTMPDAAHAYLLREVILPHGKVWRYEYHPTRPMAPGGGTPGSWSMKTVTYPDGGSVTYNYAFVDFSPGERLPKSTVVTQRTVDGATWNYSYAPATQNYDGSDLSWNSDSPMVDKTLVQGPDGTTNYQHIGFKSCETDLRFFYLMGAQLSRRTVSGDFVEGHTNSYTPREISKVTIQHPGDVPTAPETTPQIAMLKKKIVVRGKYSGGTVLGSMATTEYKDFDAYGNPQRIEEKGESAQYQYVRNTNITYFNDPANWIIGVPDDETIEGVGTITRNLDDKGRVLSESRFGVPTSYTYAATGDLASKTDARGKSVGYSNYKRGIAQTETHPEQVEIHRAVDGAGNIDWEEDGERNRTAYQYDQLNRVTKITPPAGLAIEVFWNMPDPDGNFGAGRLITRGNSREFTWRDGFDRPIKIRSSDTLRGETLEQIMRYDNTGRKVFTSYPYSGNPLAIKGMGLKYGIGNQVIEAIHDFDPAAPDVPRPSRKVEDMGQLINVTNERGKLFQYIYRHYGSHDQRDLLEVKTPEPGTNMLIVRNGVGQPTSIKQDGVERTFTYDPRYFMTSSADPEVGIIDYGRDGVGNMISRKLRGFANTIYTYDDLNRLKTVTYPDATPAVTYTYYRNNLLKTLGNGVANRSYNYDPNGNLDDETLQIGARSFFVDYEYNNMGALQRLKYPSGRSTTYNPDAWGRSTAAVPYVNALTRHPSGQIASMTYANNVTTHMGQNNRLWPDSLRFSNGAGAFINSSYIYDDNGNTKTISDSADSSFNRQLGYDDVDRLTSATGSWGQGSFEYDGRGNITEQRYGFAALFYGYNTQTNRLDSTVMFNQGAQILENFQYDRNGNMSRLHGIDYRYNEANQMVCAKCTKPDRIGDRLDRIDYTYDGAGTRVKAEDRLGETYYMYSKGGKLLWEILPSGRTKEYFYLDGRQVGTREE